ncbi:unnamed protein product [Discula destructiva]
MNGDSGSADHSHPHPRPHPHQHQHQHQQRGRTGFDPHRRQQTLTTRTSPPLSTKGKQKSVVVVHSTRLKDGDAEAENDDDDDDDDDDEDEYDEGANDTVGTLLAEIANVLADSLRVLMFADKRHWDSDEFEQVRALEGALDEAKADFQELGPLLKGSFYYENDRRLESLDELRMLRAKFAHHSLTFKDWLRQGGPINPIWARDTIDLQRQLHRAQRRAAARIYASQQDDTAGLHRCLGAFEVYRRQRRLEDRRKKYDARRRSSKYESTRDELSQAEIGAGGLQKTGRIPSWQQDTPTMSALENGNATEMDTINLNESQTPPDHHHHQHQQQNKQQAQYSQQPDALDAKLADVLEDLVPACNKVGHFERFGEGDVAFVCDFCDGFIVWEDLARLPSSLDPSALDANVTEQPNWQAKGTSLSTAEDKTVVFAPLAIANHQAPPLGDWQARLLCPYCDEYNYYEAGDEDETRYVQDDKGFGSLREFQEHLEWYHTSVAVPSLPAAAKNCVVM